MYVCAYVPLEKSLPKMTRTIFHILIVYAYLYTVHPRITPTSLRDQHIHDELKERLLRKELHDLKARRALLQKAFLDEGMNGNAKNETFQRIIDDLADTDKQAGLRELEIVMRRGLIEELQRDEHWYALSTTILEEKKDLIAWRGIYLEEATSATRNVPKLFNIVLAIGKQEQRIERMEADRLAQLDIVAGIIQTTTKITPPPKESC